MNVEKEFLEALALRLENHIINAIKESEKKIMETTQAQLDAAIAALPGQIETAVENALAPVIEALEAAAESNGVDLTSEVASLNAIPATVSGAIATAIGTPTPPPANPPAAS